MSFDAILNYLLANPFFLLTEPLSTFRVILLMKALRPDRVLPAVSHFANQIFKANLTEMIEYDLPGIVKDEVKALTPIVMSSVPGYDASFRVDHMVDQHSGVLCTSVAMGSQEGHNLADQAIATASRTGNWVLVKNVHLAPTWLKQLEKRLHNMNVHPNFRLFLTLEMNDAVPTSMLRQSVVIMNEPPPGIRASLLDSLKSISVDRLSADGPVERLRLYFHLAWLHALLVERLRYVPIGFSKIHEFNESDFDAALSTIDSWMHYVAKGRSNIDPASIPFDAIRVLLKQAIYGGRVDNDPDQRVLDRFIDQLFTHSIYDHGFTLVPPKLPSDQPVTAPEGVRIQDFVEWSHDLPEREVSSLSTVVTRMQPLMYLLVAPYMVVLTPRCRPSACGSRRRSHECQLAPTSFGIGRRGDCDAIIGSEYLRYGFDRYPRIMEPMEAVPQKRPFGATFALALHNIKSDISVSQSTIPVSRSDFM